jgi:hypothetical protein
LEDGVLSDTTEELIDDELLTDDKKWAKLSASIRPQTMTKLNEVVQQYPFRSRSEAVEIALGMLFKMVESEREGASNGPDAKHL